MIGRPLGETSGDLKIDRALAHTQACVVVCCVAVCVLCGWGRVPGTVHRGPAATQNANLTRLCRDEYPVLR